MELRSRRLKPRLLILFLFLVAFIGIRLEKAADDYTGALPITVALPNLTPPEAEQVQVVAVSPKDFFLSLKQNTTPNTWELEYQFWARAVRVYLPEALAAQARPVTITLAGDTTFKTDTATMLTQWKRVPTSAGRIGLESPPSVSAPHLPWLPAVINGPLDTPFLTIGLQAFVLLLIGGSLLTLSPRLLTPRHRAVQWLQLCLRERPALAASRTQEWGYGLAGLLCLITSLALMVRGERYGFVNDDNITQFFPTILQGCQSLEKGIFSTYNPYQLLGSPTASVGVYALTYPLTYLSYALAAHLLRDPYLTLDVFVILHLALGYGATFVLARRLGIRPALALCVALSFVLCGYLCVYTRGWFYMAPVALWTPLLLLCLYRLTDAVPLTPRWVLATGLVIGAYFHAGNAQMWSYTLLLCGLLVSLWHYGGRVAKGRLLWLLPALLLGLAIAAPLLIAQSAEVAQIDRSADFKQGTLKGLLAFLLPAPLIDTPHPSIQPGVEDIWPHLYHFAPLYFCGPVFLGLGLLALLSLPFLRWGRRLVGANAWLLCAGIALLLSFGEDGGLAQILAHLPVFNKFQHWWKFLPFVALFSALGGGLMVERWLSQSVNRLPERLLATIIPLLLGYNAALSKPVMWIADKPYPALPQEIQNLVLNPNEPLGRGLTLAPWKRDHRGFVFSMAQNFSTLYRLPMFEGYDPLVKATPLNQQANGHIFPSPELSHGNSLFTPGLPKDAVEALQHYGVRWVFMTDGVKAREHLLLIQALVGKVILRYQQPQLGIAELPGSDPLAFPEGNPAMALPITLTANGVAVDLQGQQGPVVVNFLARERLHAFTDGTLTPIQPDSWNRVRAEIPAGAKTLTLRYEPDWRKGFVLGGILIALALGILVRLYPFKPVKAIPLTK